MPNTPFIPPMLTPSPESGEAPVIPSPSLGSANLPSWMNDPRGASTYPVYPSAPAQGPFSPHPATAFIPPGSTTIPQRPLDHSMGQPHITPFGGQTQLPSWANQQGYPPNAGVGLGFGGGMSGAMYGMPGMIPGAPTPGVMPNGMQFPTPSMFPGALPGGMPGAFPSTTPGMFGGPLPGWGGASGYPQSAYPYGGGAFPGPGAFNTPNSAAAAAAWGPQSAPVHPTPGWGIPAAGGAAPAAAAPAGPIDRGNVDPGDRVDQFAEGDNYGPVLIPMLTTVVGANIEINPLISPLDDDSRPYLSWNMTFPTAACHKSSDPTTKSWSSGRNEPATYPRLASLKIVNNQLPWTFTIKASNARRGVTCGDVIDQLHNHLYMLSSAGDYNALSNAKKTELGRVYRYNRSTAPGVLGGQVGEGMRRFDFLGRKVFFGGIEKNSNRVRQICGIELPCVFYLRCQDERLMSPEERRRQSERDSAARRQEAEYRRRSAAPDIHVVPPTETSHDDDGELI